MRRHLFVLLAVLATSSSFAPPSRAEPAEPPTITWKVSNRLPQFVRSADAESYLEIVRKIMVSSRFKDKAKEDSPFSPRAGLPATRWDPVTEVYDGRFLSEPIEIDAEVKPISPRDRCAWKLNQKPIGEHGACSVSEEAIRVTPSYLSVTVLGHDGARREASIQVEPKRTIIIALGDSYASGEGVPDIAKHDDEPAVWWNRRCHRSLFAGPALAAAMLADDDTERHRSVAFFSFACSGATLLDVLEEASEGQEPPNTVRKIFKLDYQNKPLPSLPINKDVEAQLTAAERLLCGTRHDATRDECSPGPADKVYVTLSIGGNDLGFVDLIQDLLLTSIDDDVRDGWRSRRDRDLALLQKRFRTLAEDINRKLRPDNVLLTEYPDPLHNDGGNDEDRPGAQCDYREILRYNIVQRFLGGRLDLIERPLITPFPAVLTDKEASFAQSHFLSPLNKKLADAAWTNKNRNWRLVGGIARASSRFGFCSTNSHFRTVQQAKVQQGDHLPDFLRRISLGAAHPNMRGQSLFGCMIAARINALERGSLPWRAPLPWPKICQPNCWDALLDSNGWIGLDDGPPTPYTGRAGEERADCS